MARLADSLLAYGGCGTIRQGNDYARFDDAGRLVSIRFIGTLPALYAIMKQSFTKRK